MKRYEKYKPSAIEWLGDIPAHWEVKRVKDIFQQINDSSSDIKENTYVPLENIESFYGRLIKRTSNENGEITTLFKKGDILLNKLRPYLAKVLLADFDGGVSGEVIVYRINTKYRSKINNGYYFYRFLSQEFISKINSITDGVKMPRSNPNKIFALDIQFPTQSEQTAIANYLDTKTAAIDRKIELLTAKANKYKALRRSLINETVCRGLNPNAPLKDSGIEWIGMIPEHWVAYRMKDLGFLYSGLSGKAGDDFNQDENENNCDFIPFTNIFNNDTINPDIMGKVVVFENEKQNKVKKDDLFFLMSSEDYDGLGKSSLLAINLKNTYLNSFCKGYRITKKNVFPSFLNYQLQSDTFRKVMQIEGKGFTRLNLKSEKVTDFKVFIPYTVEEQQTIVEYLDTKTTQIYTILTNISEQIGKLTQLRKTLINDVVTGKIKVTE